MSQKMQVKLLRAIQEKTVRRVGDNREIAVDVRIITATNRDLIEAMEQGAFRSDLYYRLNVISIRVPPLRERRDDIPILMQHFLNRYNQKFAKNVTHFEKAVMDCFAAYRWPGNVRELENFIERGVALEKGSVFTAAALPPEVVYNLDSAPDRGEDWAARLAQGELDFNAYLDGLSKRILVRALEQNGGNVKRTAQRLKLNYRSLRYLIEKFKLKYR